MNFSLVEAAALPDGTRVFTAPAPQAGAFGGVSITGHDSGFTVVTGVQLGGLEQLGHNYMVDGLHDAQTNGLVAYSAVALNEDVTVLLLGPVTAIEAVVD